MALHLIIDGYNLIRQSTELSRLDAVDLEAGRNALLENLHAYKKIKHHRITVVFDGGRGNSYQTTTCNHKGISVIYSPKGVEADEIIKKLAKEKREQCIIVSSDLDVVGYAQTQNAAVISSPDFLNKLTFAVYALEKGIGDTGCDFNEEKKNIQKMTTKKGPSRRLSKKDRKNRQRITKI